MVDHSTYLAEKLIEFQRINNLTQHEVAEKLNISQPTYNNWINGKNIISIKFYPSIATLCGLDMKEVIPPEMEVTLSMPSSNSTYTVDALSLHQKLNYHLEQRLEFQIKENQRLRRAIEVLKSKEG